MIIGGLAAQPEPGKVVCVELWGIDCLSLKTFQNFLKMIDCVIIAFKKGHFDEKRRQPWENAHVPSKANTPQLGAGLLLGMLRDPGKGRTG